MPSEETVAGGGAGSGKNSLSRRDFLKLGGVGLAGVAMLGGSGCGGGGEASGKVVFASWPGPSSFHGLIDKFNEQNKGKFQVTYRVMAADTWQRFDMFKTELQAGGGDIDIVGGTSSWTAEFAENGWVTDVSSRFPKDQRSKFVKGQIQSLTYESKIWGVPWLADVGILFYRQDLLDQSGFSEPPKTWEELKEMSKKVMKDSATRYGFVFQGAINETGTCNGLEYIWTHGGEVLDGDRVIIGSPESVAGLTTEQSMVAEGVAPRAVANYTLLESLTAFLNGDAIFCRWWPSLYGTASDPGMSKIKPEQMGVSPLPVGDEQRQTTSCLGGDNLLINASSEMKDEAWEFIRFITSEESQKTWALAEPNVPARKTLYDHRQVLDAMPVISTTKKALQSARLRPVSPYYSEISRKMAEQFNSVLTDDTLPEQAVETLQSELTQVIERGQ